MSVKTTGNDLTYETLRSALIENDYLVDNDRWFLTSLTQEMIDDIIWVPRGVEDSGKRLIYGRP